MQPSTCSTYAVEILTSGRLANIQLLVGIVGCFSPTPPTQRHPMVDHIYNNISRQACPQMSHKPCIIAVKVPNTTSYQQQVEAHVYQCIVAYIGKGI